MYQNIFSRSLFQLIILSKWGPQKFELSEKECDLASKMLNFLIEKPNKERPDVFKWYLDIIKLIVESWKSVLKVPTNTIKHYIESDGKFDIGIQLTSIFLVNKMEAWIQNDSETFLELLLKKLKKTTKSLMKPCAETIGLFLRYFDNPEYTLKVDRHMQKVEISDYILCLEGNYFFVIRNSTSTGMG